jgi:ribosomal protein S27AE
MIERFLEPELYEKPPSVCPKADCGGTFFISHEDGWQCFNCMKIIYKDNTMVANPSLLRRYQHEKHRTRV